jgi:hypothetical protein
MASQDTATTTSPFQKFLRAFFKKRCLLNLF